MKTEFKKENEKKSTGKKGILIAFGFNLFPSIENSSLCLAFNLSCTSTETPAEALKSCSMCCCFTLTILLVL